MAIRRVLGMVGLLVPTVVAGCQVSDADLIHAIAGTVEQCVPNCGESCGKCKWGPDDYTVQCNNGMCLVPAGPFWQGCNASVDTRCFSEEKPYHEVNVPAFEIDKYEVTVGEYGNCVSASACTSTVTWPYCNQGKSGKIAHPMNCITWDQAREYCAWAGKRLCSESEWEKASRGTDGRKYPWGNETATCEYAVMYGGDKGCGEDSTWHVGSEADGSSPYGALDMSGNVWEWVEDDFHDSYDGAPTDGNAWLDYPRAPGRVRRGGGFGSSHYDLLSSFRGDYAPATISELTGVRCCRSK